jgi:hypothetical protein
VRTAFAHGDPEQRGWLIAECAIGSMPGSANAEYIVQCVNAHDELVEVLRAAATSLETISTLSGRYSYGDPPIRTHMDTFMDVRAFATSRAKVARDALAKVTGIPDQGTGFLPKKLEQMGSKKK